MGLGKTIMIAALIHTNYMTQGSQRSSPAMASEDSEEASSEDELQQSDCDEGKPAKGANCPNGKREPPFYKNGKTSVSAVTNKRASGRNAATLVVAPTSLLTQWKDELRRTSKDRLSVLVYNDQKDISHLVDELDGGVDVVIVSYGKMGIEFEKYASEATGSLGRRPKNGIFAIDWYRIILDEVSTDQKA